MIFNAHKLSNVLGLIWILYIIPSQQCMCCNSLLWGFKKNYQVANWFLELSFSRR